MRFVPLAMLLVGVAGCGKSHSTGDPRSRAIISKSKELRDRACACADTMCAAAVRKDHDIWLRRQIDEIAKLGEPTSTKAEQDRASGYQRELFACLATYGADKTAPAPIPRAPAPSDSPVPTPAPVTP